MRTPLFVACAMDRVSCVEFLCSINDSEEELNHRDRRGDTPMHAAACNGGHACLKILLEMGVSPEVRNTKGYRPIELAARRGHAECEKLLSEYHMHHNTDTYFDSVLFLATIEGHKQVKQAVENKNEYEIIQKTKTKLKPSDVKRIDSHWSLRRNRSMRLQQYGSWIAYEDPELHSVYWYNVHSKESSWERPEAVRKMQDEKLEGLKPGWSKKMKNSMRIKKLGEWIEYHGKDAKTFYYNESTGAFQWERPLEAHNSFRASSSAAAAVASNYVEPEWAAYKDPNTGMRFWYNATTNESQWETPPGYEEEENVSEQFEDSDVHEVHCDDDLGI